MEDSDPKQEQQENKKQALIAKIFSRAQAICLASATILAGLDPALRLDGAEQKDGYHGIDMVWEFDA